MSGFQEILVIGLIIAVIFVLPRMTGRGNRPSPSRARPLSGLGALSVRIRLAIVASALWVILASALFRPWQGDPVPFFYAGLGPVAVAWGLIWVLAGFRR